MRILSIMLGAALLMSAAAAPAAAQGGDRAVSGGLSLPRDHQYERYDPATGYSRVDVGQVPDLVRDNVAVYDRTANAWVFRPQRGTNPSYAASAGDQGRWGQAGERGTWERATGTVVDVQSDNELRLRLDSGREITVDTSRVQNRPARNLRTGDRVTVAGVVTAPNYLEAREIGGGQAAASPGRGQGRAISGQVESISGNTMVLRGPNNNLTVDLSSVDPQVVSNLRPGDRVTVVPSEWTGHLQLRAAQVQRDTSAPAASPRLR